MSEPMFINGYLNQHDERYEALNSTINAHISRFMKNRLLDCSNTELRAFEQDIIASVSLNMSTDRLIREVKKRKQK